MARFTAGFAWLVDGLAEAGFGDGEAQRGARWRERGKGERLERERDGCKRGTFGISDEPLTWFRDLDGRFESLEI